MNDQLYVIDFHAHLQDTGTQAKLWPQERKNLLSQHAPPIFNKLAGFTEPIHDSFARMLALKYRGAVSRYLYGSFGKIALLEVMRLFKQYTVELLLASMEQNNIQHTVIHSIEPLTSTANILEITKQHRDRLSVFASVGKHQPDPFGYLSQFAEAGTISGIKLHPLVGGYACLEFFDKTKDVAALAQQYDLPIMIHTGHIPVRTLNFPGCNEITAIEPLIQTFPQVKFVLAHIGWESWRHILNLAKQYPNTWVETSWQPAKVIRRAVDELGCERVLFGSDFPLFRQSLALNNVRKALTPREFVYVASTNAMHLLKLTSKPAQKSAV